LVRAGGSARRAAWVRAGEAVGRERAGSLRFVVGLFVVADVEGFGVSPTTASVSCTGAAGAGVAALVVVDATGV
jgi:hypothetical protein